MLLRLLPSINSWDKLVRMLEDVPLKSDAERQIENRMAQEAFTLLPSIDDWNELMRMHVEVSYRSLAELQIEARMEILISAITLAKCPVWFSRLLERPKNCHVRAALDAKVVELKAQLEK